MTIKNSELQVMAVVDGLLQSLESKEAIRRVVEWLASKYDITVSGNLEALRERESMSGLHFLSKNELLHNMGRVIDKLESKTESNMALIVGYFLQINGARSFLKGREMGMFLKDLGYKVKNITAAIRGLVTKKPQLMLEFGKSGKRQQAHKKYLLTTAGIKRVEEMLRRVL